MIRLPRISWRTSLTMCAALVIAAVGAVIAAPSLKEIEVPSDLIRDVPMRFGDWQAQTSGSASNQVSLVTGGEPNMNQPYDQVVMRTYVNGHGDAVMLAIAWGRAQRQEVKIHRPDLCYVAQGHRIVSMRPVTFDAIHGTQRPVTGKRLVTDSARGGEAVSYWIRIGDLYSEDAIDTRLHIFREGLAGRIPDGILVRASTLIATQTQSEQAHMLAEQFLVELLAALPPNAHYMLVH